MNPLGSRAQVMELARLLEGGVSGAGSAAAPQVMLAMRLRALGATMATSDSSRFVPREDFRARLRTRLVAVAQVQAAAAADVPFAEPIARPRPLEAVATWTQSRKAQRRIGVTAGAMAGVIAFTGVGIASTRALPGQPFYSLKRGAEAVQLSLASGDQAKGTKHLEFAATRLREVKALANGENQLALGSSSTLAASQSLGGPLQQRINDTLADFNAETRSGRMLLEGVYRKTGKPAPLNILKTFSAEQKLRLTELIPALPVESQAVAKASLELVKQVQASATEQLALGICGGECFPGNAGPTLPEVPEPSPGATATPTPDDNGVPPCSCPTPAPEPTEPVEPTEPASPSPEPTSSPTPAPTSSPKPTPSQSPSLLPIPLPTILPTPVPTLVPLPEPVGSTVEDLANGQVPVVGKLP